MCPVCNGPGVEGRPDDLDGDAPGHGDTDTDTDTHAHPDTDPGLDRDAGR